MLTSLGSTPDRLSRWSFTLVVGAGLILGAFFSRLLAEIPWIEWPFHRWEPTIALTLGAGLLLGWIWKAILRRHLSRGGLLADGPQASSFLSLYILVLYLLRPTPDFLQATVLLVGAVGLGLLLSIRRPYSGHDWLVPLALFLCSLALYLGTLAPAVGTRDGYELQAISATLGFAHPTGYPLFPLLGRLWIWLFPFGSMAWRINVLCALFAAFSVLFLYFVARRVLGHRTFAVLAALLFAVSHTLWTQASQPEKYTLNALFVSLILYVAFGTTDPESRAPYPNLRWLAFVYGLSLTHHRTVLMLAPALVLYIFWRDPKLIKRPREWMIALGVAFIPLLIYLYIPWRANRQGWAMTVEEFFRYISGSFYGPAVRLMDWLDPERARMFWRFVVTQFGYVGVGLGLVGLAGLAWRRQWRFLVCTALAYLSYYFWGTVWYAYYNDVNSFIPNHMIFSVWIGAGALALWLEVTLRWPQVPRIGQAFFWTLLALLPLSLVWTNARQVDLSDDWDRTRWGEMTIELGIAPGATILADREKHPPLDYFARIERRRPDLDVVILGGEQAYIERLRWDLAQGKTVYLARFLPGLENTYHLRSLGPLVEVGTEPWDDECERCSSSVVFGEQFELLGVETEKDVTLRPGDVLPLTLFWKATSRASANYQVNLRLVGAQGQVWWQSADHPVSGMYPTSAWKPLEVIPDWHQVPILAEMPPGPYTLQVGLFLPFSSEGIPVDRGEPWWSVCKLQVVPGDIEAPNPLRAIAPERIQLVGYDLPGQAPPSSRTLLSLYWQALADLPSYEVGTRLVTSGEESEWTWTVSGRGEYPTSRWPVGQTVLTTHSLSMPSISEESKEVVVQVAVRPAGEQGNHIEFFPRWLAPATTVLSLPRVMVTGEPPNAPGAVNFGDRILLLGAVLERDVLKVDTPVGFSVRWQCMRAMEADYTLFVHVLGQDGTIKGQIDVWPLEGTYPTSSWREGEIVKDSYALYLDADAPPGTYRLEIGWYLLETMRRLPVLDAKGAAIDDKVLLPSVTIVE